MTVDRETEIRKAQGARLAEVRQEAGFKSARSAAIELGWPESSYRAHENGSRTIGRDDAERYLSRFSALVGRRIADPQYVLFGGEKTPFITTRSDVPVVGRIGAGAEILPEFEQVPPDGLYQVEVMVPISGGSVAFEVEGDSMYPRYDHGDIVICTEGGAAFESLVGREAAVKTADGRRYLKRIIRSDIPGAFDLVSHNADTIRGVHLEWASPIDHVIRSGRWRRMTREEMAARESRRKKIAT